MNMKLLLQAPTPDSPTVEVDRQLHTAIVALRGYLIRVRAAGRFADGTAGILLEREGDAEIAVAALEHVGIHAAVS
jgi:hypothetical protein